MDDILAVIARSSEKEAFLANFKEKCYSKPLTLEKGSDGTFLETTFESDGLNCEFRLKNANEDADKVWRYHHYESSLPYEMKRACLLATLRKVHKMASSRVQLIKSAEAKLQEFTQLQYPKGIRKFMCAIMARDSSNTAWRYVRSQQH